MDIEFILNDALNKALCQKGRIQNPNSNTIAEFVTKYLQNEKFSLNSVVKSFYCTERIKGNECYTQCSNCRGYDKYVVNK